MAGVDEKGKRRESRVTSATDSGTSRGRLHFRSNWVAKERIDKGSIGKVSFSLGPTEQ